MESNAWARFRWKRSVWFLNTVVIGLAAEAAGDRGPAFRAEVTELVRTSSRLDDTGPVAIPATYLASIGVRSAV